jgi:dTDP-4-amino-4,6-dideoxygalactose transaminase
MEGDHVSIPLLDLQAQYLELKGELDSAIGEVMSTAGFIGGPRVRDLETAIAAYCGTKHAVACGNGTDALFLIMHALGIGKGDEVITTPFTFIATAEAIAHVGATPVFVDIEPGTYNIDVSQIEAAITERTKAVMPVHIFGQCADMDAINEIARRHGLRVVEDACQAIGATYKGKHAGALADAAAFSFFPSKNLGCAGDGGMLTTDDDEIAASCRKLANHGTTVKYHHDAIGVNSRLDALQAAILLVKLPHLDRWNAERRAAATLYDELLADTSLGLTSVREYGDGVVHLYIAASPERDRLMGALKKAGIGTAAYYPIPLHRQEAFAHLGYAEGSLPVAEAACPQTFALPAFPGITRKQQETVVAALLEAGA